MQIKPSPTSFWSLVKGVKAVTPVLTAAAEQAEAASRALAGLVWSIPIRAEASYRDSETACLALLQELGDVAWKLEAQRDSDASLRVRVKELDNAADAFLTTSEQLEACMCMCELAEAGKAEWSAVIACATSALAALDMCVGWGGPGVDSYITTLPCEDEVAAVEDGIWMREGLDVTGCVVGGVGTAVFVPGTSPAARANNVVWVIPKDTHGCLIDTLCEGDVVVEATGAAITDHVLVRPGVYELRYTVPDEAIDVITLSVSVFGSPILSPPLRVLVGCAALGVYSHTLKVKHDLYNAGLAITPDGTRMVVSNSGTRQVGVYALPGGESVCMFGGKGKAPGLFEDPHGLCCPSDASILVAESLNCRVQEVTLTGRHVRFIGVGQLSDGALRVCCDGECVAVATRGLTASLGKVVLFDYTSGHVLKAFGTSTIQGSTPVCVAFNDDGETLLLGDVRGGRLSVWSKGGDLIDSLNHATEFACPSSICLHW